MHYENKLFTEFALLFKENTKLLREVCIAVVQLITCGVEGPLGRQLDRQMLFICFDS